jgi:ATP-binding cassette subfamily C protein LapB
MGVDMPIGEQGKGLSGGQKQSVAVARALVHDPVILLFDELSAAMDNQTEQEVIRNIQAFAGDKTLLLSTHRSSLLSLVDRIIVMDAGKIVANGPKANVLEALKSGLIPAADRERKV